MTADETKKLQIAVYGAESLTHSAIPGRKEHDDFYIYTGNTKHFTNDSLAKWDIIVLPYTAHLKILQDSYYRDHSNLEGQPIEIVNLEQKIGAAIRAGHSVCFLVETLIGVPYPSILKVNIELIYETYKNKTIEKDLSDNVIGHRILRSMKISPNFNEALSSGYRIARGEFQKYLLNYASGRVWFECPKTTEPIDVICLDDKGHIAGFCVTRGKGHLFFLPYMRHPTNDLDEAMSALCSGLVTYMTKTAIEEPAWAREFLFADEVPLKTKRDGFEKSLVDLDNKLALFTQLRTILWQRDYALQKSVLQFVRQLGLETRENEVYEEDFWITLDGKDILMVEVKSNNGNLPRQDIGKLDDHRKSRGKEDDFPALLVCNTFATRQGIELKDVRIEPNVCIRAAQDRILVMRTLDLVRLRELIAQGKLTSQQFVELICQESGWLKVDSEGYGILRE